MILAPLLFFTQSTHAVTLESLDLRKMVCGWEHPRADESVGGHPLKIGDASFDHGVGTHAVSQFRIRLNGDAESFTAQVGVDAETGEQGSIDFSVWVDGHKKWDSGVMRGGEAAKPCSVPLAGAKELMLSVGDAGDGIDYDHADWADAAINVKDGAAAPVALSTQIAVEPPMPIHYGDLPGVTINGPHIIGCTPGRPFLFKIPATFPSSYQPFMRYARPQDGPFQVVGKLPPGLSLERASGIIVGSVKKPGTFTFSINVSAGHYGSDSRQYTIVAGVHKLALTPPMGWNSWNVWAGAVSQDKMKASADAFIKAGLADYGYQYVNIDDTWEAGRGDDGMVQTNQKFPNMKALGDYIHSLGLKFGIYSSPGPTTCAGFTGSYQHELDDARQYANWGVDYLKYDWCSYGSIAPRNPSLADYQKPYIVMREALDQVNRDIVYSLCQYGMGDVYKWGHSVAGGNLWRTTGDIGDSWASMSGIGFSHDIRSPYVKPGGWNDPDMLVVGRLGWGPNPRPTRLTPNEQITHITLWSMLAAPLLIGCDLTKIDKFTKAILCNHDVLEVDQDSLGHAATRLTQDGQLEVWTRPLWDGTTAVALFNRGSEKADVKCDLHKLGYKTAQPVRDLWQEKDLPGRTMLVHGMVPAHGAMLFKVGVAR